MTKIDSYLNRIICGDCLEVMREMPDDSVDLIVTSPPYNLRNTPKIIGTTRFGSRKILSFMHQGYNKHDDKMESGQYVLWQQACLVEMWRLLKETGAIFYNHKWRVQSGQLQDRSDIVRGFPVRQIIIWQRTGGVNFNPGYFLPTYEVIYLIAKPKFRLVPSANRCGDVWQIHQDQKNPHPAPFPVALPQRIIESTDAEIVLDPFMGSGTTAVAAKRLGRRYIGIEQSSDYCRMAEARIAGTPVTPGQRTLLDRIERRTL